MTVSPPRTPPRRPERPRRTVVRWNAWNLLLLIPLLSLFTPMFNRLEPRLMGIPFFYWFQLFGLFLGAAVTALVHLTTKDRDYIVVDRPDLLNIDSLDEGARR